MSKDACEVLFGQCAEVEDDATVRQRCAEDLLLSGVLRRDAHILVGEDDVVVRAFACATRCAVKVADATDTD